MLLNRPSGSRVGRLAVDRIEIDDLVLEGLNIGGGGDCGFSRVGGAKRSITPWWKVRCGEVTGKGREGGEVAGGSLEVSVAETPRRGRRRLVETSIASSDLPDTELKFDEASEFLLVLRFFVVFCPLRVLFPSADSDEECARSSEGSVDISDAYAPWQSLYGIEELMIRI